MGRLAHAYACRIYFQSWVAVCFFRTSACAKRFTWKWLDFHVMNIQVTYIFIPIVSHKDSFCHRGKSTLGIGLFIHEPLREPLIRNNFKAIFNIYFSASTLGNLSFLKRNIRSPRASVSASPVNEALKRYWLKKEARHGVKAFCSRCFQNKMVKL